MYHLRNFLVKKAISPSNFFQTPAHNCPSSRPLYSRLPPPLPPIPHLLPPIPHPISPYPRSPCPPPPKCTMLTNLYENYYPKKLLHISNLSMNESRTRPRLSSLLHEIRKLLQHQVHVLLCKCSQIETGLTCCCRRI